MTWLWTAIPILLVLVAAGILSFVYWDWLNGDCQNESGSSVIRNLVLTVAAVIALPLAIWRGVVADRQAKTAQGSLQNERYQKGAEMLGSKELSIRLGGIYALARLAQEHPEDYHMQIMSLLCASVRTSPDPDPDPTQIIGQEEVRKDIQAIMTEILGRNKAQIKIEKKEQYRLNLSGVQLRRADLYEATLSGATLIEANLNDTTLIFADLSEANLRRARLISADLTNANLSKTILSEAVLIKANLSNANLSGTKLTSATLSNANLSNANLSNAKLIEANLSNANLRGCVGLTQEQIDQTVANIDSPPNIEGVADANTGNPLVWRGRPIT